METNLDVNLVILIMGSGLILTFLFFIIWSIFKSWFSLILAIIIFGLCAWFVYEKFDFKAFPETIGHLREKTVEFIDPDVDLDRDDE